jgi:hypothetical protein
MRTTIDLPDELYRQVRVRAAQDGLRLKALIRRYIERGLSQGAPPSGEAARRQRSDLPVARGATGHALPSFTNAEIDAILTADEWEATRARRD